MSGFLGVWIPVDCSYRRVHGCLDSGFPDEFMGVWIPGRLDSDEFMGVWIPDPNVDVPRFSHLSVESGSLSFMR